MISADIRHPEWSARIHDWHKWRLTYCGGDHFIDHYLEKFSTREDTADFKNRKKVTPSADFAKAAVNDVKNAIFQRTADITRKGGTDSYQDAVVGLDGGVDLHDASMNEFIGTQVLPELLTMAKVGIYIDMPEISGITMADALGKHPYLYVYRAEEILSWSYRAENPKELQSVLLMDWIDECDFATGLPKGKICRHRHLWIDENGFVNVQFYNSDCAPIQKDGSPSLEPIILDITRIPVVILEITDSLLASIANHQIALVNLESSDVNYVLKANFPFYVEQHDERADPSYLRQGMDDGTKAEADSAKSKDIKTGVVHGRKYPTGANTPAFIHPSSEPLQASMQKQDKLKDDIRQLINVALSNIKPKMASAESKAIDERGLEAGLSYIGLVLQHGEREVANFWSLYEGSKEIATIKYPEKYSLQTDEDRRAEVKELEELRDSVPSNTFQKAVSKRIAVVLLGTKITNEEMDKIHSEIDKAAAITADIDHVLALVEQGILSPEGAAKLLGIDPKEVDKASKAHAERLARIAEAQSAGKEMGARGVPDASGQPGQDSKGEKAASRETDQDDIPQDKTRGEGE